MVTLSSVETMIVLGVSRASLQY
jgi:hypothetical protein